MKKIEDLLLSIEVAVIGPTLKQGVSVVLRDN
jgi:hypothetical protein